MTVSRRRRFVASGIVVAAVVAVVVARWPARDSTTTTHGAEVSRVTKTTPAPGQPTTTAGKTPSLYANLAREVIADPVRGDLPRVYVPNGGSNSVSVIDPVSRTVIDTLRVGRQPQHIVPAYDLRTLWLLDNQGNSVQPIDPRTGQLGAAMPVDDPYNMYFTPDGASAVVVAEAHQRLDFRDPHTMQPQSSLTVTGCDGLNHADYSGDLSYLLVTCEFAGRLAKIDLATRTVTATLDLAPSASERQRTSTCTIGPSGGTSGSMPQDVRVGPDGHHFYVADMLAGGVYVVDGDTFTVTSFIPTGVGAHGITPSHDGTMLYVANRGSDTTAGRPHGAGSVSVIDVALGRVVATWAVPGGGSPDMGNLTADGRELWLSGRYDSEVYVFDTVHGVLAARIPVGSGPHGLTVWPQPGSYSLGHTGNMR